MRLIDVDAFLERTSKDPLFPLVERYGLSRVIRSEPTVDAVPVVRCKDCKYNVANMEKDPLDMNDYTDIVCSYFMTDGMEPYDFCSKGEIK